MFLARLLGYFSRQVASVANSSHLLPAALTTAVAAASYARAVAAYSRDSICIPYTRYGYVAPSKTKSERQGVFVGIIADNYRALDISWNKVFHFNSGKMSNVLLLWHQLPVVPRARSAEPQIPQHALFPINTPLNQVVLGSLQAN